MGVRMPVVLAANGEAIVVVGDCWERIARLARRIALQTQGTIDWGDCFRSAGIGKPRARGEA